MADSRSQAGSIPGAPARRAKKLQHALLVSLRDHRVRLTILAAGLSRGADAAQLFESIRSLAHEIRAAATKFQAIEVGIAAHALERAAEAASGIQADNSDVDVWAALEALRDLLGTVSGERAAS
jgi:hypothetical protein